MRSQSQRRLCGQSGRPLFSTNVIERFESGQYLVEESDFTLARAVTTLEIPQYSLFLHLLRASFPPLTRQYGQSIRDRFSLAPGPMYHPLQDNQSFCKRKPQQEDLSASVRNQTQERRL